MAQQGDGPMSTPSVQTHGEEVDQQSNKSPKSESVKPAKVSETEDPIDPQIYDLYQ